MLVRTERRYSPKGWDGHGPGLEASHQREITSGQLSPGIVLPGGAGQ
jgi:hypothetical protein